MEKPLQSGEHQEADDERLQLARMMWKAARGELETGPLSYGQQAMWFIHQMEPLDAAYNTHFAARIVAGIDVAAMRQAFQGLVDRHGVLRTSYRLQGDVPEQRVEAAAEVAFREVQAVGWTEERLRAVLIEETRRPFDLTTGPVMRVHLYHLPFDQAVLLVTIHHIAIDYWSLAVLLDDFRRLYTGQPLPALAAGYDKFVRWQREFISSPRGVQSGDYWHDRLSGELPLLQFVKTASAAPPLADAHSSGTFIFQLDRHLAERLKLLGQSLGATLFTVLLAAFNVMLGRYTHQDDIVVGTPTAGRNRPEFEAVVGYLVNAVVIRTAIPALQPFAEYVRQVRQDVLEAMEHQDYPFPLVVQELQPLRHLKRTPLIRAMFAFQKAPRLEEQGLTSFILGAPGSKLQFGDMELRPLDLPQQEGQFDLTLHLDATSLAGAIQYDTALFDRDAIERMASHYETLLAGIAADPNCRIGELPMLTPGELAELERWNATAAPYERTACIHQLFERQVARAPQAEAIRCGETRISYRSLNERANRLAHYMQAEGIGAGSRVGICLPRTPELIVVALAALKAGAAYVPLDPSHPAERLGDVLTDAGASLVLTDERHAERLTEGLAAVQGRRADSAGAGADTSDQERVLGQVQGADSGPTREAGCSQPCEAPEPIRLLCIDREAKAIAAAPSSAPVCAADPDAAERLAYIIYTSGSTGKPKGVMVQHRPVINLITWANTSFGMSERDRVLWVTSLGFDLSVYDLFGVLAAGGSICIADEQEVRDPERLLTLLEREEITFWDSAPAALQQLAPLLEEQVEPSRGRLRLVFLSGDWIPVDLPGRVRRRYPGAEIVGLGGATEATVWSNVYRIGEVPAEWTSIPYGKPIANAVYRVLDRSLGRCPVGVPGELYIGGEVLALGYVDAQLTAERFIADPYGEPGARLYRTGDLARYRPDGNLEFLGRLDHQVKLRGYRVETGEIESVLKRHPAVREAVVVVHGEGEARRLAGYVVPNIGRVDERVGSASTIGQETIQQEAVSEWEQVFDETYRRPSPSTRLDRRFNIAGWTSSYTDQMLPESDMLEWTEQTVARIKALSPKRVLEIGCGTGLLLSRIAPSCELYWGFDISREALDYVQTLLREERMDHVQLFCSPADTLREVEAESFDTIIVNSVVQYFPDVAYLLHVMEEAIRVLKPGGALFIGDVRNYALLKPFHLSVEMYRGADDLQMERLLQQVNKRMDMERELLVDPGLFERLAYRYAGRLQIVCQAKESLSPNELTKFRYDVTIRKTSSADSGPPCQPWLAWDSESELAEVVAREWRRRSGGIVGVRGVPSGALVSEWHAEQLLHSGTWPPTLAQFRSKVRQLTELAPGWTTTRLRALGDQLDADTYILLAEQPYVWDVLYVPRGWQDLREALRSRGVASGLEQQWGVYVNHPSLSRISRRLLPELRTLLRQALPEPMVPSVLMALYELPVSSNGKVDRKALPLPERQSTSRHGAQAAPRDLLEMRLIKLWEELLGVQPIGVQDSFFDLGGHSLLAVRLMTQIEEAFGIKLPMSALFEHATIERLAAALGDSSSLDGYGGALVPIRRGDYDAALFMIHPTGGNVLCYASLAGHLADGYDIYALQSPALAGDFRYSDSVEAMASHYIDCMRSVQPHGPYRVAGWSFGGTVAYEIARRLERSGDRVELLALIDCPAPSYTKRMPQMSNTEFLLSFCREAERFFGRSLAISGEELQRLEPDEQLAYIWDVMQESAMISPGTSSAQFGRLLEVFRKHLHALRSYDPMPDYAGPLTLYRAALPSEAEWGDASTDEDDGVRGWSAYVSQSVQAFTIPGDHVAMMTEPHVQRLAEQLDRQIRELSPGLKIGMS